MKNLKLISLMLTLMMIFGLLMSCSSNESMPDSAIAPTEKTSETSQPQNTEETVEPDDVNKLPIVEEKVTFVAWSQLMPHYQTFMTSMNETAAYQVLEKKTNIHIEWQHPSSANPGEAFNLLIVSQDYPDFIDGFTSFYKYGLDKAVEDDVIIPLNDIIKNYIPNYDRLIDEKGVRNDVTTDSGLMGQLYCIYNKPNDAAFGFMVRKDWLDDLGLDAPVTYDDWYDMLVKFRDIKGAKSPMLLNAQYNCDSPYNNYKAGYQTSYTFFNKDGTVMYGPIMQEYKEWLRMMAKWYSEGLIDREFVTRDNTVFFILDQAQMFNGDTGVWLGAPRGNYTGNTAYTTGLTSDPKWYCTSIRNPVLKQGDPMHFRATSAAIGDGSVITTDCHDPVTLAKWFNYCFSEQGSIDICYGIEGESFIYNENGEPELQSKWFEETYGNPDFSVTRHLVGPLGYTAMYFVTLKNADIPLRPDYQVEATETIMKDSNDWAMPLYMSPTIEETNEVTTIMSDIETYVQERTTKIIMGIEPVDSYDEVIERIYAMGIERAIELKQAAIDRYLARGK